MLSSYTLDCKQTKDNRVVVHTVHSGQIPHAGDHLQSYLRIWNERNLLMIIRPALPAILAHSNIIVIPAMVMSIIGGILIYGTIISFGMFFQEEQEF